VRKLGIAAIAAAGLMLGGCGTTLSDLVETGKADVEEALRSAEAYDDPMAAQCWRFVLKLAEKQPTEVKGLASGYQKDRNIRRLATSSDEAQMACAPMIRDSRNAIIDILM
jgi:hypothetical protein